MASAKLVFGYIGTQNRTLTSEQDEIATAQADMDKTFNLSMIYCSGVDQMASNLLSHSMKSSDISHHIQGQHTELKLPSD